MSVLAVDPAFGLVIADAVVMWGVHMWLGSRTMKARKTFGVKLPKLYEGTEGSKFDCYQRSHMNYVETSTFVAPLLFCGGLCAPRVTAAGGALFIAGRIAYALGYSTGDPAKRYNGSFGYLGIFTMLGTSIYSALKIGRIIA